MPLTRQSLKGFEFHLLRHSLKDFLSFGNAINYLYDCINYRCTMISQSCICIPINVMPVNEGAMFLWLPFNPFSIFEMLLAMLFCTANGPGRNTAIKPVII